MSQEEIFRNRTARERENVAPATGTVTRADLAEALHRQTTHTRADCAKFVDIVLEEIFECIVAREDVKLSSFGAFQVRSKKERLGRNPKTGADARITARLVVTFKPSNILRAKVNGATHGNGLDKD